MFRKIFNIGYKVLIIAFVVIIIGLHLLMIFIWYSDGEINQFFTKNNVTHEIAYYNHNGKFFRSIISGNLSSEKCIIMSHGAPGSWDAFKDYMVDEKLTTASKLISYDRPGYGPNDKHAVTSIKEQSEALQVLRNNIDCSECILVGHSYGGPIIVQNAIDYPNDVKEVILIAPAIDPATEKFWWFSPLSYWRATNWLMPRLLRVAGDEKYTHVEELENMALQFDSLNVPVLLVHSLDDAIAPAAGNIDFLENHIDDSLFTSIIFKDKGHLVIWNDVDTIVQIIYSSIQSYDEEVFIE